MNKEKITRMIQHTAAQLCVREAAEGDKESRTITGYAILFDTLSAPFPSWEENEEVYEVISRGAVTNELLDASDIKMTMFHDRQLILARSNKGEGTLKYGIDDKGVYFEFEAPHTADGDKALELVRRGDLAGCSFAFTTHYYDENFVMPEIVKRDGKTIITYHVNRMTGIYDFTLAADPAYPDTSCEALREITEDVTGKKEQAEREKAEAEEAAKAAAEKQKRIDAKIAEIRKEIDRDI